MAKIIFVSDSGESRTIQAENGVSVMEAAVREGVVGIDGDCGGAVACGTCHVYVDLHWLAIIGPAQSEDEREMLSLTGSAHPNSRLSCQITMTDELDGLVLTTPAAQY